jgi:hypothetical protein
MEYMEITLPDGDGLCSDDDCPCAYPGELIPHGQGFLFISKEVVEFRRDALTRKEVQMKIKKMAERFNGALTVARDVYSPTLMCEQGARKRKLDLEIAAKDAKYCWEMGLAPLRPTPFEGSLMAKIEKGQLKDESN